MLIINKIKTRRGFLSACLIPQKINEIPESTGLTKNPGTTNNSNSEDQNPEIKKGSEIPRLEIRKPGSNIPKNSKFEIKKIRKTFVTGAAPV